jgi:hypothetical protein
MSEILLSDFNKVEFSLQILKNTQISNFMTIRPVSADIFHADGHIETNNQSSQFYESAWELIQQWKVHFSYPEYECSMFLQKGCGCEPQTTFSNLIYNDVSDKGQKVHALLSQRRKPSTTVNGVTSQKAVIFRSDYGLIPSFCTV